MGNASGLTWALLFAACSVWVFGSILLRPHFGTGLSAIISAFKAAIPLCFFAFFNDGGWVQVDDLVYFDDATQIYHGGYNFFSDLFLTLIDPEGPGTVRRLVGSEHTLYYWWNVLAFRIFGEYYASAVFLNVGLTFIAALLLKRIVRRCGFSEHYQRCFLLFFLIQWDMVVWSSFLNLKDTLVITMTIASMLALVTIIQEWARGRFAPGSVLSLTILLFLFTTLRHYIPVLVAASAGIWVLTQSRDRRRLYLIPPLIGLALFFKPWETQYADYIHLTIPLYSLARFMMMPLFWFIEPEREGFVLISSLFHWLMVVPMIYGAFLLWFEAREIRLLLFYFALVVGFYLMVPELQGTRQRFQLTFVIAWMQFHGAWTLLQFVPMRSHSHLQRSPFILRELQQS